MTSKQKLIRIASAVFALLLIPLIFTHLTSEVNWNPGDFLIAGVLLFLLGLCLQFAADKISQTMYRYSVFAAIIFLFVIIWMELAVGIFGTLFAGA